MVNFNNESAGGGFVIWVFKVILQKIILPMVKWKLC